MLSANRDGRGSSEFVGPFVRSGDATNQWFRVVMNKETSKLIDTLGPSGLAGLRTLAVAIQGSPDYDRTVRLILERMEPGLVNLPPASEVRLDTLPVPPRSCLNFVESKSTVRQEVPHSSFRPPRAVIRSGMDLYQEWCRDKKRASRSEHAMNVPWAIARK